MTRDELILRTRQLVAEGDRLQQSPSLGSIEIEVASGCRVK